MIRRSNPSTRRCSDGSPKRERMVAPNLPTEILAANCHHPQEIDFLRYRRHAKDAAGARYLAIRAHDTERKGLGGGEG